MRPLNPHNLDRWIEREDNSDSEVEIDEWRSPVSAPLYRPPKEMTMITPLCELCPPGPDDDHHTAADVRAVVRYYSYPGGRKMLHHSEPTDLCFACLAVVKAAGYLSPHAAVQHYPIEDAIT